MTSNFPLPPSNFSLPPSNFILRHLRRALATFAGTQPDGGGEIDPARPDEELLADLAEAIALVRAFLYDS